MQQYCYHLQSDRLNLFRSKYHIRDYLYFLFEILIIIFQIKLNH